MADIPQSTIHCCVLESESTDAAVINPLAKGLCDLNPVLMNHNHVFTSHRGLKYTPGRFLGYEGMSLRFLANEGG